jgi:hypothetical protein
MKNSVPWNGVHNLFLSPVAVPNERIRDGSAERLDQLQPHPEDNDPSR